MNGRISGRVKCTSCGFDADVYCGDERGAANVESAARSLGWRIWSGQTLGGADREYRLCPVCAGNATPEQKQEIRGWDAECHTCNLAMSEDWADERDGAFTEADAKEWRDDHECEPDVSLIAPKAMATAGAS